MSGKASAKKVQAGPTWADLQIALDESVKLQSHYAKLLNMWDGGHRKQFATADDWIARLRETKTLKRTRRAA